MKNLNMAFTDAEYRRMRKAKEDHSPYMDWKTFIMVRCCKGVSIHNRSKLK